MSQPPPATSQPPPATSQPPSATSQPPSAVSQPAISQPSTTDQPLPNVRPPLPDVSLPDVPLRQPLPAVATLPPIDGGGEGSQYLTENEPLKVYSGHDKLPDDTNDTDYRRRMRDCCVDELCGIKCRLRTSCTALCQICPNFGNGRVSACPCFMWFD